MAKRMKKKRDRKVFRKTADKTKTVNVKPMLFRGGIRL